jgi:hypothetical protein
VREVMFGPRPSAVLRFDHAGRSGRVRVYYSVVARAADSGFAAVAGSRTMRGTGAGFPAIKCTVEVDRPGYFGYLGWIQWLTQGPAGSPPADAKVDRLPAFLDLDLPFLAVGYAPSVFDSPAFEVLPPDDFRARLFLCVLPIMSRREPVVPLLGLRWGFHRRSESGGCTPYPLERATRRDWREVRAELVGRHPGWTFAPTFRPPS